MSRRNPEPKPKRPSRVTTPEHVSPAVKLVFAEMARQNKTYMDVEYSSGVLKPTIVAWRHRNSPNLNNISAVLSYLNFDFIPVPRQDAIPAEVVEALKPIAERLDLTMPNAIRLAAEIAVQARCQAAEASAA